MPSVIHVRGKYHGPPALPPPVPTIASFNPNSGNVGTPVVITGTNYINVAAVRFNGVAAVYVVDSDTQISAIVPGGATTGVITVQTAGGSVNSASNFTVTTTPPPGGYAFPTTVFNFPLLPDDSGVAANDGMMNIADYGCVANPAPANIAAVAAANRAAIQSMISANFHAYKDFSKKTIFIPNGTWYVSGLGSSTRGIFEKRPMVAAGQFTHGLRIQGQSESGAIIRLVDNDPAFQNAADPRFVIFQSNMEADSRPHGRTDGTGLEAYKHIIRDITIDLGAGNGGAVGINVMMHNHGAIRRITVQDAIGAGRSLVEADRALSGLDELRQGAGPNLLHRITVKGCEYGFRLGTAMCGQLIEHLRLVNIGTCGVTTDSNGLFIRGFVAENMKVPVAEIRSGTSINHFSNNSESTSSPPHNTEGWVHSLTGSVLYNGPEMGYLLIVDAVIQGTGVASGLTAIRNQTPGGKMFLRNITETGYARTAQELGGGGPPGHGIGVGSSEYASPPRQNLWGQTPVSLNIPIVDTPAKPYSAIGQWTNGANAPGVTLTNAGEATTVTSYASLQAMIDNCTTDTLYFPSTRDGRLRLPGSGTLIIRGPARHFIGMGIEIFGTAGSVLTLRFEHPTRPVGSETVIWEDFRREGINTNVQLATPRDVVLLDNTISGITNTAASTGTLFIEDICPGSMSFDFPQDVFSRQHNCDGGGLVGKYSGGDFVCMFYKSEPKASNQSCRSLPVNWSGRIEILGGWMGSTAGIAMTAPIWECRNGSPATNNQLSVAGFATSLGGTAGTFAIFASETQNGALRTCVPGGNAFAGPLAPRDSLHHMTLYRSRYTP